MEDEKSRERYRASFHRIHGTDLGPTARIAYVWFRWWMRREIANAKTPEEIELIGATPRAHAFWFVCGLVFAVPIVMVVMFLMTL